MNTIIVPFVVIISFLISCNTTSPKKTPLSHQEKMKNSIRTEKNGWILIHIEGTPDFIGYQHGYLLANEIIDLRGAMAMLYQKTTKKNWDFYREESYRIFWPKVPVEYQEEIMGIVNGVDAKLGKGTIDTKDLVAINSAFEMTDYFVPWLEKHEKPYNQEHCSAFAATGSWTKDGKIVMAHNNWIDYVLGERSNIIIDIMPMNGNRIIMDATPGFIHSGDDFNINSAGLIVTETTIRGFMGFDTTGVAEFIRARKAIQYASTIDQWIAMMKEKNSGGFANDWLIGDTKTGEIARYELGLKNQFLERTTKGYFVGANFPVNEKLIKEETSFDPLSPDISPNVRRLRWEVLMRDYKGRIDVETAKVFMGDHFDMRQNQEKASRFTLCGHFDLDEFGKSGVGRYPPYALMGGVQAKATDSNLAGHMQFWAIMGHPCGQSFVAKDFLEAHPEYDYQKEYLRDMPGQKWFLTEKIKNR